MTRSWIAVLVALGILVAGCGSSGSGGGERVAAGFYPIAFAAREIGGRGVGVTDLTPPGTEPHDLELTPDLVRKIRSADLALLLGHGFQPQLERAAAGVRVVELLDTPRLHRFSNGDPHVWLDPQRYALIARRIGSALGRRRAAARFIARLRSLDREYRAGLSHCARHAIVTSHEAFAYLAQRYGLKQIGVTGLTPEAEPAPRDLQRVVGLVRSTGTTTVFFETLVSPRIADTVARETGTRTAVLNPIEGLTPDEQKRGDDYFSLMRSNLVHLRRALGCR